MAIGEWRFILAASCESALERLGAPRGTCAAETGGEPKYSTRTTTRRVGQAVWLWACDSTQYILAN
jgi:hypothetical protein